MDIYLVEASGEKFQLPVNPEEIRISREKQYETVNILALGEIDVAQQEKVKEISFSSFFPKVADLRYCRYADVLDPQEAMNRLTSMMNAKQPVRLIITETAVNVLVYVSAHASTFSGGEPGDVFYDATFRTWREMKVRQAPGSAAAAAAARPDTKPVPKVYTVKAGDTLSAIAKRELGSSSSWKAIYDKNKALIGSDANKIVPGQKLVMP
ncbi:LysM peptidoglycan-binding domain-containing protein [Cohnella zeiphila]|uniref:LysM peptidoglycan-binding domain-containing protein n=1 Tax=Cohnella zeiphila TaxID=2761120 RepID=A0A7X0VUA5_9BACL|nr:LysM peptidoglycan-binding domain-containing protein [Cohnella zeiphila]MBB6730057.1 LysM peptidoglycan-binding domain-containing protein [Cohnella zeiphila]